MDHLEKELEKLDVAILERGETDFSQAFDIAVDKHTFVGMVGPVPDEGWLLFVESTLGWWKRLTGVKDGAEHGLIMRAIEQVLREDPHISNVRLYRDADQWNRGADGVSP